jgi:putative ABC transport system substrate-binding protein
MMGFGCSAGKTAKTSRSRRDGAVFDADLAKQYARYLVALKPNVLVCSTIPTTEALAEEARTIPIVFVNLVDPMGSGFVESLGRPGGNLTGLVNNEPTMGREMA